MRPTGARRAGLFPTAARLFEVLPRPLRRHLLMRAWLQMTGEDPLQLVRIRDDAFGYADMRNGFLRLIVIEGDFERDFFAIADRFLAEGGTFLDVGANHGLLSFGLAAKHGDKIDFHLFEPNRDLAASIDRTGALYPTMRRRVFESAVSDREGTVRFAIDRAQSGMSHISASGELEVEAVTLDAHFERNALASAELVKIDIEGFELLALKGAARALRRRAIKAVYFEYCEKWLVRVGDPKEVLGFLREVGFEPCLCHRADLEDRGGGTHTIGEGSPGHGVLLRPLDGDAAPPSTDLLAVPREALVQV